MKRRCTRCRLFAGLAFISVLICASPSVSGDGLDAMAGKALFDRLWVPAPASTDASDGLGPLFNARSCATCHAGGGGARVIVHADGQADFLGAVVRFGTSTGAHDPYYGAQLSTQAVPGLASEGSAQFLPSLHMILDGPPLDASIKSSVRLAPSLRGRAAFNDVPDAEILKRADPSDADGDGISGRANIVAGRVGRYGWKAQNPTLDDQIAHAFALDMGLSSPRQPHPHGDCTAAQTACLAAATGESPAFDGREVSNQMIDLVATYLASLAAPARTADAPREQLFAAAGCASCHMPTLNGKNGKPVDAFTDLLLHDMGHQLDDAVGEPGVASSEWLTPSLLDGRGMAGVRRYLHDGSAATIADAIGKHGGEAHASRDAFRKLAPHDRARLLEYVKGL
ncbi:MAG: hypothetical protein K2X41_05985 [Hyphomicrobium sp.]|nr:hypothetical protein [Hyphomicrobium sp.]